MVVGGWGVGVHVFFSPNILTLCYCLGQKEKKKRKSQYGRLSQFHLTREQKSKERRDQENKILWTCPVAVLVPGYWGGIVSTWPKKINWQTSHHRSFEESSPEYNPIKRKNKSFMHVMSLHLGRTSVEVSGISVRVLFSSQIC